MTFRDPTATMGTKQRNEGSLMIDRQRMLERFVDLVETDNSTGQEQAVSRKLREMLAQVGVTMTEDDAGPKVGGNAGNLYGYIPGTLDLPPVLLSSHMDAVEPAKGKKAVVHEDGTITSDGTTVLGADDLAGLNVILEAVISVLESGRPHRPIELLFTVGEETYCTGIHEFDFSKIRSREAYVYDLTGPIGGASNEAPSILSYKGTFLGRAAHAGFSPEKGIHAIQAAATAIANLSCGHVRDTTVSVGTIHGGTADNVVPESCVVTGEIRGLLDASARRELENVRRTMERAAEQFGAELRFEDKTLVMAYKVEPTEPVAKRFYAACGQVGVEPKLMPTYGGSDNNPFFQYGIHGLVVAPGMNNCHSCSEYTSIQDMEKAAELTEAMLLSAE